MEILRRLCALFLPPADASFCREKRRKKKERKKRTEEEKEKMQLRFSSYGYFCVINSTNSASLPKINISRNIPRTVCISNNVPPPILKPLVQRKISSPDFAHHCFSKFLGFVKRVWIVREIKAVSIERNGDEGGEIDDRTGEGGGGRGYDRCRVPRGV